MAFTDTIEFGYLIFGLLGLGSFILAIVEGITLYRDWDQVYIIKRHRMLVLTKFVGIIVLVFIILPVQATLIPYDINDNWSMFFIEQTNNLVRYCWLTITVLRFWLFFFDMNVTKFKSQLGWRIIIDPNCESTNWYFNRMDTFGNSRYLFKYCLLAVIVMESIMICLRLSDSHEIEYFIGCLFMFIGYIVGSVVYIKLKYFSFDFFDKFMIRRELLIICVWLVLYASFGTVGNIIFINDNISDESKLFQLYFLLLHLSMGTAISFTMIVVPKISMIKATNSKRYQKRYGKKRKQSTRKINGSRSRSSVALKRSVRNDLSRHWSKVIVTTFGYECLMKHLESEFSIENLLFLTEYVQIKDVLSGNFDEIMQNIVNNNRDAAFALDLNYGTKMGTIRTVVHARMTSMTSNSLRSLSLRGINLREVNISINRDTNGNNTSNNTINNTSSNTSSNASNTSGNTTSNTSSSKASTPVIINSSNYSNNSNNSNNSINNAHTIPTSLLATNLQERLNSHIIDDITTINNIATIKIGNYIIDVFVSLFNKYIHHTSSVHQINISSKTRKQLEMLFNKNNSHSNNGTKVQSPLASLKNKLSNIMSNPLSGHSTELTESHTNTKSKQLHIHPERLSKQSNYGQTGNCSVENSLATSIDTVMTRDARNSVTNSSVTSTVGANSVTCSSEITANSANSANSAKSGARGRTRLAKRKLQKKSIFDQFSDNIDKYETRDELFEWLLSVLIENMEAAVNDVATLMSDSFVRFKQDSEMFEKIVQASLEYYK